MTDKVQDEKTPELIAYENETAGVTINLAKSPTPPPSQSLPKYPKIIILYFIFVIFEVFSGNLEPMPIYFQISSL